MRSNHEIENFAGRSRPLLSSLLTTGCFAQDTTADAQATPSPALLILSKQDRTLAIVDPGNLKVVARVPVGNDPHEVVASSDGKTAYVSNTASALITRWQLWT